MPIVQFDPDKMHEPRFAFFNKAGDWGPGCDNEADCEVVGYEFPSMIDPPFDIRSDTAEGKNTRGEDYRGPYVLFQVRATRQGEKNINANWFIEQNQALVTLNSLGVYVEDDGSHDADHVIGLKCIVKCGDPRPNKQGILAYSSIYNLRSTG